MTQTTKPEATQLTPGDPTPPRALAPEALRAPRHGPQGIRLGVKLGLAALLVASVFSNPAQASQHRGGHGGGGSGVPHGGGGNGPPHGGGERRGDGDRGDRRGRGGGGWGGWNGGYYPGPALIYGSPYYCRPPLIYVPYDDGYGYCE